MKNRKSIIYFLTAGLIIFSTVSSKSQDKAEAPKPERKAFESAVLLENQTDVVNTKNTFEWNIQHRFGTVTNGSSGLYGLWAGSNIPLGFSYSLSDRLSIDFIRYFVFWEMVYPERDLPVRDLPVRDFDTSETILNPNPDLPQTCFDDTWLEMFTKKYQIIFPDSLIDTREKAHYILAGYPDEWPEFPFQIQTHGMNSCTNFSISFPALAIVLIVQSSRRSIFSASESCHARLDE